MTQSLLNTTYDKLKVSLPMFDNPALMTLEKGIKEWLDIHSNKVFHAIESDVRQKHQLVWEEIIQRKIYSAADFPIFSVAIARLEQEVGCASLQNLKSWYFDCIRWKRNYADKVPEQVFFDMLRKETIIHREMTRRGYTQSKEFNNWDSALQRRMTKDGRIK